MKEFTYVIQDVQGIHARPAGLLVKCAKNLSSKVMIQKDDKSADASKLLAVMGLGIKQGQQVAVTVEGENEEADMKVIQTFFWENL